MWNLISQLLDRYWNCRKTELYAMFFHTVKKLLVYYSLRISFFIYIQNSGLYYNYNTGLCCNFFFNLIVKRLDYFHLNVFCLIKLIIQSTKGLLKRKPNKRLTKQATMNYELWTSSIQLGCLRDPNQVRLAQMWQINDFLRSVSVHFGAPRQNVLKLILKSPKCVPFCANLTQ